MALALLGYVGAPDPRTLMELRRLQERVRSLEAENLRLRSEIEALAGSVTDAHLISLEAAKEPALA